MSQKPVVDEEDLPPEWFDEFTDCVEVDVGVYRE